MMFPTGSRLLIAATVLTASMATIYGVTNGGSLGTTGLISAAAGLAVLTAINLYTRDADVSAMDTAALTDSAAAHRPPWPSLWPAVGALGALLVVVGLVTYPVVFVLGVVALLAATVEWMLQAWSERASGDESYNSEVRQRFAHPAEFPVLAALGFGVIIYSFSRIMLALSKEGGPAAFATIAALVLGAGFLVAFRRSLDSKVVGGVAAVAVLALVAGGVAAALSGEREIHPHETIEDFAAAGECGVEEMEPDDQASQTVSDKANLFAELILTDDEELVATELDVPGETSTLDVPAGQPDERHLPQRERRGAQARSRVQGAGRERGDRPARAGPGRAVHHPRRRGGQPADDVLDRSPLRGLRPVPVRRPGRRGPVDRGRRAVNLRSPATQAVAGRSLRWRSGRSHRTTSTVSRVTSCRVRRLAVAAAGLAAAAALAGCADNAPQDTWQPEGDNAQKIHDLQWPVFAIAGLVGLAVFTAVIWCIYRYRDRGQPIPKQTHGRPALEIGLTILPA